MGELVRDEAVKIVRRIIDGQQHPLAIRLGKCRHAFLGGARRDVFLLELAVRLENDQRDLEREVVFQVGADVLIGAFRVARHTLEVLLDLGIVVNLEVVRRIDVPVETVVVNIVLAEIRNKWRLRRGKACPAEEEQGGKQGDGDQRASSRSTTRGQAHAHKQYLWTAIRRMTHSRRTGRSAVLRTVGDLTVTFRAPANGDPSRFPVFRLRLSSGHASR